MGKQASKAASLPVEVGEGETLAQKSARLAVDGVAGNAFLALAFGVPSGMLGRDELGELHKELKQTVERTKAGGTDQADSLLTAQAVSLNQIFIELARRSALNMNEYPRAAETYMRLALKAQSQCRTTLESLAEIRNPRPVAFVKQANIANGPQQVNNGEAVYQAEYEVPRAEVETQQTKLLEENANVTRLDTRAASKAGRGDTPLEALGAINGASDEAGKGNRVA
ncbi:hypothetical protein ACWKWK_15695 [Pseudoxanthomonas beigongshangi]